MSSVDFEDLVPGKKYRVILDGDYFCYGEFTGTFEQHLTYGVWRIEDPAGRSGYPDSELARIENLGNTRFYEVEEEA